MKSVADFKRKMVVGAIVNSKLYYLIKGEWQLRHEIKGLTVSIVQSNSFAIAVPYEYKAGLCDSWTNWPKKHQFEVINDNTAAINLLGARLVFEFVQG